MHPLGKLQVYTQAHEVAAKCRDYCLAIRDRDLQSQLMRAVRAIAANLAEGAGSESQAVFAKHIAIALASARETECHLRFAHEARMITDEQFGELTAALGNLSPRLVRLLVVVRANAARRTKVNP